ALDTHTLDENDQPEPVFRVIALPDLREWLAHLTRKGLSRTTVARKTTAVRQFMSWLVRQGIREDNPAARLVTSKQSTHLPDTLSQNQVREALDALESKVAGSESDALDPLALRDLALFEVLYATGARVAEIAALNIADIEFDRSMVRVTGKGDKQRVVPITLPAQ